MSIYAMPPKAQAGFCVLLRSIQFFAVTGFVQSVNLHWTCLGQLPRRKQARPPGNRTSSHHMTLDDAQMLRIALSPRRRGHTCKDGLLLDR